MQIQKLGLQDTILPPGAAGPEADDAAQAQSPSAPGVMPTAKAVMPQDKVDLCAGAGSAVATGPGRSDADPPLVALPFVPVNRMAINVVMVLPG